MSGYSVFMRYAASSIIVSCITLATLLGVFTQQATAQQPRHNVIIFVADGLRRGSVTAEAMPTFWKLRKAGVDFENSHASFPTYTTANASVIATGHAIGDTGDYSNVIYPGVWLSKPDPQATGGTIVPFLENDEYLADMNSVFQGNYLGEKPLLSVAREKGFDVASVGKLGPTAIQQVDALSWNPFGLMETNDAIIVDDSTGQSSGILLPADVLQAMDIAGVTRDAPLRSNGYADRSQSNNGYSGDAQNAGTLEANRVQQQWYADVATKVLLPKFEAEKKPFVLLFWSRDPDGTQHNEGDSLQALTPGINGPTVERALKNVDNNLKQLLDWLDAHPAVKAVTDVFITSDHGFATISRREVGNRVFTSEPSAALTYEPGAKDKPEPPGTLPTGFLAVDLGIREHLRVFDPAVRSTSGSSAYDEVSISGETSHYPVSGSALLGGTVKQVDGSDAKLIVVANGGTDLLYLPTKDVAVLRSTLASLTELDYVGSIFVDDAYCPKAADCPGALPLSDIGFIGHSHVPRPAIVVAFRTFYGKPSDLQSALQVSDTTLQEGQGMHGGFGRDQTLNNMEAIGPDFKPHYIDSKPVGNIDIVPTLAHILGIDMPSVGTLRGRVIGEALAKEQPSVPRTAEPFSKTITSAPTSSGIVTVLQFQEISGYRYNDRACRVKKGDPLQCGE